MDYKSFNYTLDMGQPPSGFSAPAKALWWERKGYWEKAHEIVKDLTGKDAAWVHAYLHRKGGDLMNAAYWYDQAGKKDTTKDHDEEFREIIGSLLPDN
ncbi:MAG TPA: hypothetical protein VE870_10010 [Bacteroidales bacterium]|nr:hypothetical protein [Bacteroidales bacterium]